VNLAESVSELEWDSEVADFVFDSVCSAAFLADFGRAFGSPNSTQARLRFAPGSVVQQVQRVLNKRKYKCVELVLI